MIRFQIILTATAMVAIVACGQEAQQSGGGTGDMANPAQASMAPPPGHVNVVAFCDTMGHGMGATIRPWRVHTRGASDVTWNIVAPRSGGTTRDSTTTLGRVDTDQWSFQDTSYTTNNHSITAALLSPVPTDTFPYRLTIRCPNDTIVIDPIVIVDDASGPDSTKASQE